jgi:hypothetical protein
MQELFLRDGGFLKSIADQTFIEPYFAFVVLTKDYHFRSDIERTHSINQSFKTNDGLLDYVENFEQRKFFELW